MLPLRRGCRCGFWLADVHFAQIQAIVELSTEPTLDVNYAAFNDFLTKKGTANG